MALSIQMCVDNLLWDRDEEKISGGYTIGFLNRSVMPRHSPISSRFNF
jgi:hypothetical protein